MCQPKRRCYFMLLWVYWEPRAGTIFVHFRAERGRAVTSAEGAKRIEIDRLHLEVLYAVEVAPADLLMQIILGAHSGLAI
jgi:hypothetical protein